MKRKVVVDQNTTIVEVTSLYNSDSVGFITDHGHNKGFITRIEYDEYKAVGFDSQKYYGSQGSKEVVAEKLIRAGFSVFQFSNDAELKAWLFD